MHLKTQESIFPNDSLYIPKKTFVIYYSMEK